MPLRSYSSVHDRRYSRKASDYSFRLCVRNCRRYLANFGIHGSTPHRGKDCTGMGTGLNTSTVPVLQSELSKAHLRGKMVMAEMTITILGFLLRIG
jgi:hypothetical protein